MQNEKSVEKWVYLKAKHGLNLKMDLRPNWSQFGRGNRGEEKEKRRREEEEEEEEEERRRTSKPRSRGMELWIFGMETNLDYGFYEIWHVSLGLYDDYFAQT